MKKQLFSFFYAFRGVWNAICTEAHLRFHLTAGFYVLLFSLFFEWNAAQYGIVIVLIAAVIAAELFNTAIENVCDLITKEKNTYIRISKDISAAAVLIFAFAAVAVAVLFFGNAAAFVRMISFFADNPLPAALLLLSAICAVLFVAWGPRGFRKKIHKNR